MTTSNHSRKASGKDFIATLVCCGALTLGGALLEPAIVLAADEPGSSGGDLVVRRLSPEQYRQVITDLFGPTIKLGGRFEPEVRASGLLAVGAGKVSITASGLEQYDAIAHAVATQAVDERHRATLIPCKPAAVAGPDDACSGEFISKAGMLLYRRPLSPGEIQAQVAVANAAAKSLKSFYAGLEMSLAGMLEAPEFLYRKEVAEPDPAHPGQYRIDTFSKASQLSFLLWNTSPDAVLLAAAQSGELNNQKGLAKQVERLLTSPRLEFGVRAFFTDMLGFDEFGTLSKDAAIYPKFTPGAGEDAREQTLRTIVDHVVVRRGDYRDLFTTRKTFLTPVLGSIYGVSVPDDATAPNGAPDSWMAYEYPAGDPRGVGILTQASFLALHAHPGRSSATLRGKALREVILCQKVPDPPGNVNFTVVQDTKNPQFKTARERVTAHRTDPTCAGCHKLIDPMGLALENFDGASGYRTTENGANIDASGELDGVKFADAAGLGTTVHDHPATPGCLVNRLYSYALGRPPAKGEAEFVKYLEKGFAADGYRMTDLLRRIATSDAFYRVAPSQTGARESGPAGVALERGESQERVQ